MQIPFQMHKHTSMTSSHASERMTNIELLMNVHPRIYDWITNNLIKMLIRRIVISFENIDRRK